MAKNISFTLKYWRQNGPREKGHFDVREMHDIPDDTSFLEMLDILNEELINEGQEPFVFDHDCREGSFTSTKVFQAPQLGHFPAQCALSAPHSLQQ